jgi:hypothetical protein
VVAVSGGDAGLAVPAQQADGQAAFPPLSFAPRTVLPSTAMTSRPPPDTALV